MEATYVKARYARMCAYACAYSVKYHFAQYVSRRKHAIMTDGIDGRAEIPFLTVMSTDFDKDLAIVRRVLERFEERIHSRGAFSLGERAEMAAGWWFYDVLATQDGLQKLFQAILPPDLRSKKSAAVKIVDAFQDQLRKSGSGARVKMHGDVPFAAPWWGWLMR